MTDNPSPQDPEVLRLMCVERAWALMSPDDLEPLKMAIVAGAKNGQEAWELAWLVVQELLTRVEQLEEEAGEPR